MNIETIKLKNGFKQNVKLIEAAKYFNSLQLISIVVKFWREVQVVLKNINIK